MTLWHFVAFGVALLFSLIFLILAVFVSNKTKTSLALQFLSLATITIGPIFGYLAVEKLYKPVLISDLQIKHLYYQDIGELKGLITNPNTLDLIDCKIKAKAYQMPTSAVDYVVKLFNPKSVGSTTISVNAGTTRAFDIDLHGIKYSDQNITTSISVRCR